MFKAIYVLLIGLTLVFSPICLSFADDDSGMPSIDTQVTGVTYDAAKKEISISGSMFGAYNDSAFKAGKNKITAASGSSTVNLALAKSCADSGCWTPTKITCDVSSLPAGTYNVNVEVKGLGTGDAKSFTIAPVIEYGSLAGFVFEIRLINKNPVKVPLQGAMVNIAGKGIGTNSNNLTNFVIGQIPAGTYSITVGKPGYRPVFRNGIVIKKGNNRLIPDVELRR